MSASRSRTGRSPEIDLARLPSLPLGELHELWRSTFRTSKPPPKRRLLVRELAYHVQSLRLGGLDADTRRRLDAAVRAAVQAFGGRGRSGHATEPHEDGDTRDADQPQPVAKSNAAHPGSVRQRLRSHPKSHPRPRHRPRPAAPFLPAAATLVRVWNGRSHEVTVAEGGRAFVYRGTTYRSLTAVARVITGTEWSGPRFFGLAARPGKEVP